jgi:hypothetical protein
VQQMAETLGGNAALQPRPAGRGEQKSVDEVYKETYGILLRFGQVDQVAHLAPIWSRLANCAKGEQQSVLQQELTKVCLARGLAPELYCPVVTTGVKQMVTTFQFAGHGGDDLTFRVPAFSCQLHRLRGLLSRPGHCRGSSPS